MRARGCQALPRPTYRNTGWVCAGEGLTVMLRTGDIPCVLPNAMVEDAMRQEWASAYSPEPFTGGDHFHCMTPDVWLHA